MSLAPGVRARTVDTDRLRLHVYESGPDDGVPVVLGAAGHVPGWPGADAFPPQAMVRQTASVLDRYRAAGGSVRAEVLEGSGHGPFLDAPDRFRQLLFDFLDDA